jgi:hypothetical protein
MSKISTTLSIDQKIVCPKKGLVEIIILLSKALAFFDVSNGDIYNLNILYLNNRIINKKMLYFLDSNLFKDTIIFVT